MLIKTTAKLASFWLVLFLLTFQFAHAQKAITGTVTDQDGKGVPGVSVTVKGTNTATQTDANGNFSISASDNATLLFSSVGFTNVEVGVAGRSTVNASLTSQNQNLTEVVVIGYGAARRKDLTGAVTSIKAKDFNVGAIVSPDQLIQGKVSGVQILANNGAPGAAYTVRIRGNNSIRAGSQPLFVLDGVPLDGRTARPNLNAAGLGNTPTNNPLNFINPEDIASIDVLKDASAAAIYGSRAANGVILVTTKRGSTGAMRVDLNASVGVSNMMRSLDVLNGDEYRAALQKYSLTTGNFGGNVNALDEITRNAMVQNYSLSISGGNDVSRYRASIGVFNQEGIIVKNDFEKYTASFLGNFKALESKKLGLDVNLFATNIDETIAPITNDAGFQGSLVQTALQWNPTLSLTNGNNLRAPSNDPNLANTTINPLALSRYYNDRVDLNRLFLIASPYYTFNKNFEYRATISFTNETGSRRASMSRLINIPGIEGQGWANLADVNMQTLLFNNTLNYNTALSSQLNLTALLGYEYMDFKYRSDGQLYRGFGIDEYDYTKLINSASQVLASEGSSFEDPTTELQSVFARVGLNFSDKYLLTATVRRDGSTKFGDNNKYGVFPSFAARWNLHRESFLLGNSFFNQLALRVGWGMTGNQEIPSGAAQERYAYTPGGGARLINAPNPDLQWESSTTFNVGIDFAIAKNRITGTLDFFRRNTNDLLFNFEVIQPAPPGSRIWQNLDGTIVNSGFEIGMFYNIVNQRDIGFEIGANATFLTNSFEDYTGPNILTGGLHGQGVSGASVQQMRNGLPLNAFYTRRWTGLDNTGKNVFAANEELQYVGDPNPSTLLGFSTDLRVQKFGFRTNWNGAFGHDIYNNTLNSVLNISNLQSGRNVSPQFLEGTKEELTNPASPSSRYLEKGSFLRLNNASISYNFGSVGKVFRNLSLSLTGQNLFVITDFSGFDPEVNVDKQVDGVSSFGIEYAPYPMARNFILGARISF